MRIRNQGNVFWAFVSVEVEVDGEIVGTWDGFKGVGKKKTAFLALKYYKMEVEGPGELKFDKPMLGNVYLSLKSSCK